LGLAIVLLAAGAACSTQDTAQNAAGGQLFARGIDQITDLYIEPVSGQKLVFVGAKNLAKLDPRLSVTVGGDVRDRDQVTLAYDGISIANSPVPPGIDGRDGGDMVAALVAAAKKASPHIAALPQEKVDQAVFDGMTGALDRFSRYAPPEEARDQRAARDGFGGIGVTLETTSNDFSITSVAEQGPAARAGIRAGDKIVAINGVSVAGRHASDIVHQLRGPIGSIVGLTIERPGGAGTRELRIERALVVAPTVTYARDGNIAVFKVASFNQSTTQRLTEGIIEAQRQAGGRLAGIVLDLRGNPGGLLDQAVSLSDLFIAKGPIIATVGRHPASHQYFAATGHSIAPSTPLVVLINGGSAAASQIVAAALQDIGRAVVVGSSSYGKGTVQTVMRLPNDGELTLTWARLVTPSGYYLQQHGVVPTLCTSGLGDGDAALDAATRPGAASAAADPSRPRASLDDPSWSALRRACPAQQTSPALDLKVAERVLSDPARYTAALDVIHAKNVSALSPAPGAGALTASGAGLSSSPR
ncbi:MAG: PDZ domain-containing protein, partial [Alphaproteobacteria bacterium]|nr:PDZ domain-containing protein [Alphaproteobacteria bacterium]